MKPERMQILERALERKMPWGLFKGQPLEDIPDRYLRWVSENANNDDIAADAGFVLQWRKEMGVRV